MKTIRIFISSPGDVQEERERARSVVHQLRRRYAGRLDLQALLWEELPLQADMSFQKGIDMVLSETGIDVAVFILWSRLGSPTGPLMLGDQGKIYRSGTEREWDLMLKARERCEREGSPPRPAILVYTRKDEASFVERLRSKNDDERSQEVLQKQLVQQFIQEEFRDAETGDNLRAYHSFDQPTTFAQRLRIHLTNLLDSMVGNELSETVWNIDEQGPPFRGLDVFEFEDAPIFFGREDEIVSIRQRLREQAQRGKAFVLISGPSGSGKSSLARAGVLPDVCRFEIDADIKSWRWLVVTPGMLGTDLLAGFLAAFPRKRVLPELRRWSADLALPKDKQEFFAWKTKFQLRVQDALGEHQRLLILVDQLEELFSTTTISAAERDQFFQVLESLCNTGSVWIVATLRSDFYQHAQEVPELVRMKEGSGQFDLLPPTPDAISRVISGPAMLAGLQFERVGEQTLADLILREGAEHKELLPLVEHLLLELCERRTDDGKLTVEAFRQLGGVEGALKNRCEETYASVADTAQQSLDVMLADLVSLSGDGLETVVRRAVPLSRFPPQSPQRELIDAMVSARLFTASKNEAGESVVSVSHEALLRVWPRAMTWVNNNREFLRLRTTVEYAYSRWQANERDASMLLAAGLPLEEGRRLIELARCNTNLKEYIKLSIAADETAKQISANRRRVAIALMVVASVIMSALGIVAWRQAAMARDALTQVEKQNELLEVRSKVIEKERDSAKLASKREMEARLEANSRSEELEASLARSNFILATSRWAEGRALEAKELLHRIPSQHRNIEWYLQNRTFQGGYMTIYGHLSPVVHVAFSQNGSQIVSLSQDGTIKLSDANNGKELFLLKGQSGEVSGFALSPDGKRIASSCVDNTIKLLDASSGQEVSSLKGHTRGVSSLAFSPDSMQIASASRDMTIKIWDADNGKELRTLASPHKDLVLRVLFFPDGNRLATASKDNTIKIWDATSGEVLLTLIGHSEEVWGLALSQDGTRLASGSWDGSVKLWDAMSGEELRTLPGHSGWVFSVAFSPDGTQVASAGQDMTVKVWDAASGEELQTLVGHTNWVTGIAFSPDQGRIVSASYDQTIKFWDLSNHNDSWTVNAHSSEAMCVAFNSDGTRLATSSRDKTIKLWDAATCKELLTLGGHTHWVTSVAFSPDGKKVASASWDNTVRLWDATTGIQLYSLKGHDNRVWCVAYSPEGNCIASAGGDGTIVLWDAIGGKKLQTLGGHTDEVVCVAFNLDGTQIASASRDKTIKLWDVASCKELFTLAGHTYWVTSVAFSPDGKRVASASGDNTVRLWDVYNGEELHTFGGNSDHFVTSVAFSSDGKRIASAEGGISTGTIKLWDVASGEELFCSAKNSSMLYSVALGRVGRQIASASEEGKIVLWGTDDSDELRTFRGHADVVASVGFSPNGTHLVSETQGGERKVWDIVTGHEVESPEWPHLFGDQCSSPDGRLFAFPLGVDVGLVDAEFRNRPREKAFREAKAGPQPRRHRYQAESAEKRGDWYAATFHRAWVVNSIAANSTLDDERFANVESLKNAYKRWRKSIQDSPADSLANPDLLFQPTVCEILRSISVLNHEEK